MQKYLIVTADDFGLHPAVNEAVEQASRAGILTAASLMVAAPAAADAVRRARELPGLRVGLHVVLADGRAMLAPDLIPDVADRAGRMNSRMFVNGVRFFAFPGIRRQLEAEIRAQFAAGCLGRDFKSYSCGVLAIVGQIAARTCQRGSA